MDNYIQYTYYDEVGKYIAIVNQNVTEEIMEELCKKYDEVKFKE